MQKADTIQTPRTREHLPFPQKRLDELYDRGLYLQAYSEGTAAAPYPDWPGAEGLMTAAKLAHQLGSMRLGHKLIARARRKDPKNALAAYYYSWQVLQFRGPLACWDFLEAFGYPDGIGEHERSELLGARSRCAAYLRDFETAEKFLKQAEEISPGLPWLHCERSSLLEMQDRYEAALEEEEKAFAIIPWYRPAAQSKAQLLLLLNRESEALEFLQLACRSIESSALYAQLFSLQMELEQYRPALETMQQYLKHAPLVDKHTREWLELRRCDALYFSGALQQAREAAEASSETEWYHPFAARLKELEARGKSPRRKILPIGFVRQHHLTCVPATLTTICRYWNKPADHLSVAEKICYDGTPAHSERNWAEQNGFVAREFRVTTAAAEALIDRRIPFTLTTSETTSAHLQAVIGYDRVRESLFIRDPYMRHTIEFVAERSFKRYAATGPRGMVLVPKEQAALLESVDLPEAGLYDQIHELNMALERHDRARARHVFENLRTLAPEHRLTLQARRTLAGYDANNAELFAVLGDLLKQFPDDGNLQLARVSVWRELGHREERIAWLKEACAKRTTDPALLHEYVSDLMGDARNDAEAMRLLERARRMRPADAVNLHLTAGIHWKTREQERAVLLYRFAMCLEDKREQYARSYFIACRWLEQTKKALAFLTERFTRFGGKSSAPGMTLFEAYEQLDQSTSAFSVLEAAIANRGDDAMLKLYAAEVYARYRSIERAKDLLQQAKGNARELSWLRTAAILCDWTQDYKQALKYWCRLLEADPLSLEAIRASASLLDLTEGRASALRFLAAACARFPHHFFLNQLLYEYSGGEPLEEQVALLERLTTLNSMDSWAWREIALTRARQNQMDAAFEAGRRASEIDPNNTCTHGVLAWLHRHRGELALAQESYRQALILSIDNADAMQGLIDCCETIEQKREALAWAYSQLRERTTFGDGILNYGSNASAILSHDEIETALREFHRERPDLWQSCSALGFALGQAGKLEEAAKIAIEASSRFPLVPRIWADLARVCRAQLDHEGEIKALQQGLQISPRWMLLWHELALAQERAGRPREATEVLQKALLHDSRYAHTYCLLADFHLRYGPLEMASGLLRKALELDPSHRWGWQLLQACSSKLNQPNLGLDLARSLTERRAGDIASWLALAELLNGPEQTEDRLAAVEKAIALNPRSIDAREFKVIALVAAHRFDEAAQAAEPPDWVGPHPPLLRARAAWVQATRGNLRSAVEQMRSVVKDEPTLTFGWSQLCSWLIDLQDFEGAVEPAEALVRLSPMMPMSHGYAGFAKLRAGKRDEAKKHLHHALQLDPSYSFAGFTLADAEIEDGKLDAAHEVLEAMGPNAEKPALLLRKIRIALAGNMTVSALKYFRELLTEPHASEDEWSISFSRLNEAIPKELGGLLDELKVQAAEIPAPVPTMWVLNRTKRGKWFFPRQLDSFLRGKREAGEQAVAIYIEELGRMIQIAAAQRSIGSLKGLYLRRLIAKHGSWLKDHERGWGAVGYALSVCGRYRQTAAWLQDYAGRTRVEPWMVHNYIDACHVLGRDADALRAAEFALTLPAFGDQINSLLLWVALESVLDPAKEIPSLERLDESTFTNHERSMKALLDSLTELLRGTDDPRQGNFPELLRDTLPRKYSAADRAKLRDFVAVHPSGNKWARQYSRRALKAISAKSGKWWIRWTPL